MKRYDDTDDRYQQFVDDIVCSDDFEKCEKRDKKTSDCTIEKSRCWNVKKCPLGKSRRM